jgi:hypothetical protein
VPIPFYVNQTVTTGSTTNYFLFSGPVPGVASASKAARQIQTLAGTYKYLYIRTGSTQPASGSLVFGLHINNTTVMTITVAANSVAGFFSNILTTTTTVLGDYICWEMVNNATGASASVVAGNIGFSPA